MEQGEFKRWYYARGHKYSILCILSLVVASVLVLINVSVGEYQISISASYNVIYQHIIGGTDYTWRDNHVVWDMRLPRAIAGFGIGAVLAVSGAAMQSSLKNPLADPYTIGISSGASLGVILAAVFGLYLVPFIDPFSGQVVNAFVFSLLPMAMILLMSYSGKSTPSTVILIGVAIMYIFSAITSTVMLIAEPEDFAGVYKWNLGNISNIEWGSLWIIVAVSVLLTVVMRYFAPVMNILSAPDNVCRSFGIDPKFYRMVVLGIASLATAAAVCYTGTIGFVGLIVPHIARMMVGSDNRLLIPTCAGVGGIFLLVADSITKVVKYGTLPVGVLTSLIGCPMFIIIMIKFKRLNKGF
ncbi:MAG: iron ABC transporter permease [archaeon]|nr:iron ABC transporter permease [archaeon]